MKNFFNTIFTFLILILIGFSVRSQNLIQNGSFEEFQSLYPNAPNGQNDFCHLTHWQSIHTAEAYSNLPNKILATYNPTSEYIVPISGSTPFWELGPNILLPNSGNGYAGFGQCEGGKIQLNNPIEPKHWAKITFFCSFRGANTTVQISMILAKSGIGNGIYDFNENDPDLILSDCNGINPNQTHIKNSYSITSGSFPPGVWTQFEAYLFNSTSENLDHFFFLGPLGSGEYTGGTSKDYIFVDDFEVSSLDFCDHPCAFSFGDVIHSTLPNAMVGNCDGCIVDMNGSQIIANRFTLLLENVNIFKFNVFNEWGCGVNSTEIYSLKPIMDDGFSNWLFNWNGFANLNNSCSTPGDLIHPDTYVYTISLEACNAGGFMEETKSIDLIGILNPPAIIPPVPMVDYVESCCPDYRYIQNTTFETTKSYNHKVQDFILVGPNVNPELGATIGPVVFENRTNVTLEAGNFVEFIPGLNGWNGPIIVDMDLTSSLGENVEVLIKPCVSPRSLASNERHAFPYSNDTLFLTTPHNNLIVPTNNTFLKIKNETLTIGCENNLIVNVEILDCKGASLYKSNLIGNPIEIFAGQFANGIYIAKIILDNGNIEFRKFSLF